ncbi:zinc metalloprotease [Spongiivirga citrea]|uniref:Zinc metalloprotease n=1 Tax=Spongiivirga citrea TaxID=1481457 RepID=A0A6M0CGK7_9FLAO|nr:zinc metalloprotease [Spongiivirga citrea]NER17048.1 zinc metalloprotease [Spongiivirga citrea]
MKKMILGFAALSLMFTSCEKEGDQIVNDETLDGEVAFALALDQCGSMGVLEEKLAADPTLAERMSEVEAHTKYAISSGMTQRLVNGQIEIPVVYHIIYRTASENISAAQIESQTVALNEDFNLQNPGRNTIPAEFAAVESNVGISFVTEQVIRVYDRKRSWRPDDSMKFVSPAVNPEQFLNVWVVNNMPYRGGNILGYAQFPGGNRATDGIVMDHRFTGETQYSTGRTATHEVGHWLNLRHIWGDGGCGATDFVDDTPDASGNSRGCPVYPQNSCGTNDMTMNFMDYSDDPCLNMFTNGQTARMKSVFAAGGYREAMAQ